MTVCKPHIRLSWGGTLGEPGVEVWTNSLAFSGVTDTDSERFTLADLQSKIGEMAAAITSWFTGDTAMISSKAFLTWVKFNKIGADGKYIDNPNTLALAGGIHGLGFPTTIWQQSSVISLMTGQSRGRGSRGRLYPPACGAGVEPSGYMPEAIRTAMQGAAVKLIGDLNKVHPGVPIWDGIAPRWNAVIVSNGTLGRPGLLTPITHLHVDGIPDVQRRRVNRVPKQSVADTTTYINT